RIFFFQAEDGIRDRNVTGVQTCALPILDGGGGKRVVVAGAAAAERLVGAPAGTRDDLGALGGDVAAVGAGSALGRDVAVGVGLRSGGVVGGEQDRADRLGVEVGALGDGLDVGEAGRHRRGSGVGRARLRGGVAVGGRLGHGGRCGGGVGGGLG